MQIVNALEKTTLFLGTISGFAIHNPFANAYILLFGSLIGITAYALMTAAALLYLIQDNHATIARWYTIILGITLVFNILIIYKYANGGLL